MMPACPRMPQVKAATASASQVLWHMCRPHSPPVTALLTITPTGQYELQVEFGTVALRRVSFLTDVAAVERAERLLAQLEAIGFQRQRRDKRTGRGI